MPPTEPVQDWGPPGPEARPTHTLLHRAAQAAGGRLLLEPRYGYLGRLVWADGSAQPVMGSALGLNRDAAAALAADKSYTAQVLGAAGLPVPRGCLHVADRMRGALALKNARVAEALPPGTAALTFAAEMGYPVFVKPNRGSEGADVRRAGSPEDLVTDLADLSALHTHLRVEEARPGLDLRVLVLAGQVRLAYARLPAAVTGDGRRTVDALVQAHLEALRAGHRGAKIAADDPRLLRSLRTQGLGLGDIPPPGARVVLLPGANLSTGGAVRDETDRLPPQTARLAVDAAAALGLTIAGVDLLLPCPDLSPDGATVLEVNSAPGLDFYAASGAQAQARVSAVLEDAVALLRPR